MNSPLYLSEVQDMCEAAGTVSVRTSLDGENPNLERAKTIIFTLHSGIEYRFPTCVEALMSSTRESVNRCIALHADMGTAELAEDMLQEISDGVHISVLIPRFLVDLNRERQHSMMLHVLNPKDPDQEEVRRTLGNMYDTTSTVLTFLRTHIPASTGFDLHSMAGHTPTHVTEGVSLCNQGTLERNVSDWNAPGSPRNSQIICNYQSKVDGMKLITPDSALLGRCVRDSLSGVGIGTSFKKPFTLCEGMHISQVLLGGFRTAVTIEIVKDELALTSPKGGLETFVVDRDKTMIIAKALARAARKTKKHL